MRSHDAPWRSTRASNYIRAGAEAKGIWVPTEIHADFTGDALADPRFLKNCAKQNPSKFRQFLDTVGALKRLPVGV